MGDPVAYSDVPEGFQVKGQPSATSYSDIPDGFAVKSAAAQQPYTTDPVRSTYQSIMTSPLSPIKSVNNAVDDVASGVGKVASAIIPDKMKKAFAEEGDYLANKDKITSPIYTAAKEGATEIGEQIDDLSQYNKDLKKDLGALGENAKFGANLALVKPLSGAIAKGDAMSKEAIANTIPVDKQSAYIAKTLKKAGHTPEESMEIIKRAKDYGMTVGEASQNPELLGMERKISGLNKPGGETIRGFIKDRVDPKNNVSIPFKLKTMADPLVKAVDEASKNIGKITSEAPKTPIDMTKMENSLANEKRLPSSRGDTTIGKMQGYFDWAKENGNTFENWHTVKQHLWDLKQEARDPTAVEKLDEKLINKYYKTINDTLSGKAGNLPKDLTKTAQDYATQNKLFSQNVAGRTIQEVLSKMPKGGTPGQSMKYLYNKLAGSEELQEEIFGNTPAAQKEGILKLLNEVKDIARVNAGDIIKSGEEGTPSFPLNKKQALSRIYDAISDAITRKDYNALAKALTSPDAEKIAAKLGYVKPEEPAKPILRLTYTPKDPEIISGRSGNKIATPAEQHVMDQTRARMKSLGIDMGILRAQDLNVIRQMEQKYGQSELGKFIIANKNEPILGRVWEVPDTEYSKATVDRMLRDSNWNKLSSANKEKIDTEVKAAWESGKVTVADMIMSAKQAAKELAEAKGADRETKFGHNNLGDIMQGSINTGTPVENVIQP
jgi:hypothetical protein